MLAQEQHLLLPEQHLYFEPIQQFVVTFVVLSMELSLVDLMVDLVVINLVVLIHQALKQEVVVQEEIFHHTLELV